MSLLRIGTRASALAQWQAQSVREALAGAGMASELVLVRTTGDRDQVTPLREFMDKSDNKAAGKGIFIKELEEALLSESVDIAVHSMKDVPTELPHGLGISAMCLRHDVRDAIVSRGGLGFAQLPAGARIGTSSLRRQAQLRHHRSDLEMVEIRGNVDTRLAKLDRGDYDAVVLAKAGLDRLGFDQRITEVLSTDLCLPAAGQGAIGIETRTGDTSVSRAIAVLDDAETRLAVDAERIVLAGLEGGCQVPIGIWAHIARRELIIDACVLSADGSESIRVRRAGQARDAESLGRAVTTALLDGGAGRLLGLAEGPKVVGNSSGALAGE